AGDGTIRVWGLDGPTSSELLTANGQNLSSAIALSPDGQTLAFADKNSNVELWNLPRHRLLSTLQVPKIPTVPPAIWSLAFSPDGSALAEGGLDHQVRVWGFPGQVLID